MSDRYIGRLVVVVLAIAVMVTSVITDRAFAQQGWTPPVDGPSVENCAAWGCLYSHNPQAYHGRPVPVQDQTARERPMGISHNLLPDGGPEGRRFEMVLWPMVNDTVRSDPARFAAWWRLINCESRWDLFAQNSHSSASGLFQFLDRSWRWVGGPTAKALWADPMVQLVMAERLLSLQPNGWSCAGEPAPIVRPWSW